MDAASRRDIRERYKKLWPGAYEAMREELLAEVDSLASRLAVAERERDEAQQLVENRDLAIGAARRVLEEAVSRLRGLWTEQSRHDLIAYIDAALRGKEAPRA